MVHQVIVRTVVVGVGSNLGSREASIRAAHLLLDAAPGIRVIAASSLYETAPVGPPQPHYLNAALKIETDLEPPAVLGHALSVEERLGRVRSPTERWGARSLDLDLLWDERGPFSNERLDVPHRELEQRAFALAPLLEVAPELEPRYGAALEATGGALSRWLRAAKRSGDLTQTVIEADALVDACALALFAEAKEPEQLLTEERPIDSSASAFAEAANALARTGFVTRFATISHCSHTQWVAHFHGVNEAILHGRHVRLTTTSGVERAYRVRASTENPIG